MKSVFLNSKSKLNYAVILLGCVLSLSNKVYAEKVKSINTNSFNAGLNSSYLSLEDAFLYDQAFSNKRTPNRIFFYGTFTPVSNPWVLTNPSGTAKVENIISQMNTIDMGVGWLISDSIQLSFDTSVSNVKVAEAYGGDNRNHWGDSRIQLKYRLLETESMAMAIAPELYLPTGVSYVGDISGGGLSNSSLGLGAKFITEIKLSESLLNFNVGYAYFENAEIKGTPLNQYPQIDGRSRLFLGLGWLDKLSQKWAWDNELTGNLTVKSNNFTPPGEVSTGLRYQANQDTSLHFGLGTGALRGFGGNDLRLYVGFKTPFYDGKSTQSEIQESKKQDSLIESDFSAFPAEPQEPISPDFYEENLPVIPNIEKKVIYERKKIEVLEDVSFDLNKSTLTPHGRAVLTQVIKVIKNHLDVIKTVKVKGHTDHQGTDRINIPLSAARARTVRDYLIRYGIPSNILSAQGYGSQKPIYNYLKTPKRLWEKNRRVEFVIEEK